MCRNLSVCYFLFNFAFTITVKPNNKSKMNQTPITMKDIAEALNVSVATVSRALSGNKAISEKRRKEIQDYAREHNFVSNFIAESLRNSKTKPVKLIGVIVPEIVHYYFASILSGIEQEASARGYRILVAQSAEEYEREVMICQSFYQNRVGGVILSMAKTTTDYSHFIELQNRQVPLVFYDRICTGIDASRVVVDDYNAALNAVTYLIETGCRRIAFYGSDLKLEICKNRYNGYRDALLRAHLPVDDSIVVFCDNRMDAERITPEILAREDRPDAFFAINDDTAIGILYAVKHVGLRVPDDISICGFTNGIRAIACDPMLTTVDQHGMKLGKQAVSILIDQIEGILPMDKAVKKIVKTQLVIRGTTRKK